MYERRKTDNSKSFIIIITDVAFSLKENSLYKIINSFKGRKTLLFSLIKLMTNERGSEGCAGNGLK